MYRILTLNSVSPKGLGRLPPDRYQVGAEVSDPDAIIVRSADLHTRHIPASVRAIGRAGVGVNNIPVVAMSARGVPVFNAPGANANAVKELVVAGLFLASRNICQAWEFTRGLQGDDAELSRLVEAGKRSFAGLELPGRTLGVVGLGYVGRSVANIAVVLGMNVIGYDPKLTVEGAWQLSSQVQRANHLEQLLRVSDFVTFHVPLVPSTQHMINADRLRAMRSGITLLNFAREGIVDERVIYEGLRSGQIRSYVCDFPTSLLKNHERVIALPHLGASTQEAEENCAVMVVDQLRDFLENGNIRNSVNFPEVVVPRNSDHRLVVANANVPNMLGLISSAMGRARLNIHDMVNMSREELAYTVVDLDSAVSEEVRDEIARIDGVMMARVLDPPR